VRQAQQGRVVAVLKMPAAAAAVILVAAVTAVRDSTGPALRVTALHCFLNIFQQLPLGW
jgi:hypothetical protein